MQSLQDNQALRTGWERFRGEIGSGAGDERGGLQFLRPEDHRPVQADAGPTRVLPHVLPDAARRFDAPFLGRITIPRRFGPGSPRSSSRGPGLIRFVPGTTSARRVKSIEPKCCSCSRRDACLRATHRQAEPAEKTPDVSRRGGQRAPGGAGKRPIPQYPPYLRTPRGLCGLCGSA